MDIIQWIAEHGKDISIGTCVLFACIVVCSAGYGVLVRVRTRRWATSKILPMIRAHQRICAIYRVFASAGSEKPEFAQIAESYAEGVAIAANVLRSELCREVLSRDRNGATMQMIDEMVKELPVCSEARRLTS